MRKGAEKPLSVRARFKALCVQRRPVAHTGSPVFFHNEPAEARRCLEEPPRRQEIGLRIELVRRFCLLKEEAAYADPAKPGDEGTGSQALGDIASKRADICALGAGDAERCFGEREIDEIEPVDIDLSGRYDKRFPGACRLVRACATDVDRGIRRRRLEDRASET